MLSAGKQGLLHMRSCVGELVATRNPEQSPPQKMTLRCGFPDLGVKELDGERLSGSRIRFRQPRNSAVECFW